MDEDNFFGFFDPEAIVAQQEQRRMRGTDEANQFRDFITSSDRDTLELIYTS